MLKSKHFDSRIELLRIVSMYFIVLSHFSIYGNWVNLDHINGVQKVKILVFSPLGPAAALCFFLITGFFSKYNVELNVKIKKSYKRILSVWGQTFFYSVTVGIVLHLFYKTSLIALFKSFFPFTLNEYWFVTCYILLALFAPYIDLLVSQLSPSNLRRLVIILVLLQILPLLLNKIINQLLLAITMYVVGAFIARNSDSVKKLQLKQVLFTFFFFFLMEILSIYVLSEIGLGFNSLFHFTYFFGAIVIAVPLFIIFIKLKPFSNVVINNISKGVFSIYLVTEQFNMRSVIWNKILNVNAYEKSPWLPVYGIVVVFCILCICILFDYLRRLIVIMLRKIKLG